MYKQRRGLLLPQPNLHTRYSFTVQVAVFQSAEAAESRRAALAPAGTDTAQAFSTCL